MTNQIERVSKAIFKAVEDYNRQRPPEAPVLQKTMETSLYGKSGELDSIELVTLIVATEQRIEEEFGVVLNLADDRALSQKNSPFRAISSLAQYTCSLLQQTSSE